MEIKAIAYRALTLIGVSTVTMPDSPEIPPLWDALFARYDELPGVVGNDIKYLVRHSPLPDGRWTYMAALEAEGEPPAGMERVDYPAATYAVFDCTIPEIPVMVLAIYDRLLPASVWQPASDYCLELYGPDFPHDDPAGVFEFFVPVTPR